MVQRVPPEQVPIVTFAYALLRREVGAATTQKSRPKQSKRQNMVRDMKKGRSQHVAVVHCTQGQRIEPHVKTTGHHEDPPSALGGPAPLIDQNPFVADYCVFIWHTIARLCHSHVGTESTLLVASREKLPHMNCRAARAERRTFAAHHYSLSKIEPESTNTNKHKNTNTKPRSM